MERDSNRTLRDGSFLKRIPGNKLPGYVHLVPSGQQTSPDVCPYLRLHIGLPFEDENDDENDYDLIWAVAGPKNSTAPTPLLEVGAGRSQLHRQNRRARSLIHARRRFRRWVYFGFFWEVFFGSVRKLFGRSLPLRTRTKAVFEMRSFKEESIFRR